MPEMVAKVCDGGGGRGQASSKEVAAANDGAKRMVSVHMYRQNCAT